MVCDKRCRILVTGAGGFIGRALVQRLVALDADVVAASRRPEKLTLGSAALQMPDLNDPDCRFDEMLTDVDVVIHAAGLAHEDVNDDRHDQVNRRSTAALVSAARNARVRHFIFVSSVAAQSGASNKRVLTEGDIPAPDTAYGRSKLAAEEVIRTSGLNFTILRPVAVYGPDAKGSMAMLERLAQLPMSLPFSLMQTRRSVLSIENLCNAILFVLDNFNAWGKTFLVADPVPQSLSEIVSDMRFRAKRSPGLFPFPPVVLRWMLAALGKRRLAEALDAPLVVSTDRLQALGWKPVEGRPN